MNGFNSLLIIAYTIAVETINVSFLFSTDAWLKYVVLHSLRYSKIRFQLCSILIFGINSMFFIGFMNSRRGYLCFQFCFLPMRDFNSLSFIGFIITVVAADGSFLFPSDAWLQVIGFSKASLQQKWLYMFPCLFSNDAQLQFIVVYRLHYNSCG